MNLADRFEELDKKLREEKFIKGLKKRGIDAILKTAMDRL